MKRLLTLILSATLAGNAVAGPEVKQVCHNKTEKNGKTTKICKTIKVHKKLNGTAIPVK
jgi:hypothetical protein